MINSWKWDSKIRISPLWLSEVSFFCLALFPWLFLPFLFHSDELPHSLMACWSWYSVKGQAGVLIWRARWMTGSPSCVFRGPFTLWVWPFRWQPCEEHFSRAARVSPGKMKCSREGKNATSIISQMSQAASQGTHDSKFPLFWRAASTHNAPGFPRGSQRTAIR